VEFDKSLLRPSEVNFLCADPTRANQELGWYSKTTVSELATKMVEADIKRLEK
jgi:GDPmannose 4,6-dehydratase